MLKGRPVMNVRLLFFCLCVVPFIVSGSASAQEQGTGRFSGRLLTKDGKSLSGGLVYFFTEDGPKPDPERYWRIPDHLAKIGGVKGKFSVELPEGNYYVGAIKRAAGKTENGPPQVGDYFYKALDAKGKPKLFTVKKGKTLNIGTLPEAIRFTGLVAGSTPSAIEGRVRFSDGKPVAGALVFAFLSDEMKVKPAFASYATGTDGKYILRVHEGGDYFLRVRDHYGGGPPETGALMGTFGGEAPAAVSVRTGETTTGIDITVDRFKGRGQEGQRERPQQ